jgi:FkbM family methyltransferase
MSDTAVPRAPTWKDRAALALAHAARPVFRRLPEATRERLHLGPVVRHLGWRPLHVEFRTTDGFLLRGPLHESMIGRLFLDDVWEGGLVRLLRAKLRPGDVFVDAGSHFGYMSLVASRLVGPEGRVVAIDASPSIFARLQTTLAENGVTNATCFNLAITDTPRTLTVYLGGAVNPGNTTVVDDPVELKRRNAKAEARIEGRPLPDIVPPDLLARAALIKIDVEGHEMEVLRGLLPALDRLREDVVIMVELNQYMLSKAGETGQSVLAPFRARGFRAFDVPDERGVAAPLDDVDRHYNPHGVVDVVLSRRPPMGG